MKVKLGMLYSKQGVSLMVVLLFMLIATIAATATWKWITSEGKSSESRMLQREAYQSAVAGIENARAWMTFNSNEAGALLRQYLYKNSGVYKKPEERQPINIDAAVRSFANGSKQDNHVWLMDANVDEFPYKVKILSEGISRNGIARHTEVAIFNVSGLYQVTTSEAQAEKHIPIDFEYAYFGGSYDGAGDLAITSAVVNGNWYGNPQSISGNFIVTGNAMLTGNNVNVGPLMCVGGSATMENGGLTGQDVYIGKHVKPMTGNISGNAYFEGAVTQGSTGPIVIAGNANIDNAFMTNQTTSTDYVHIGGSLCMGENGVVVSKGEKSAFQVDGSVWMPGDLNVWFGDASGDDCSCFKLTCSYLKCKCGGSYCKEGTAGAVCDTIAYSPSFYPWYENACQASNNGKWLNNSLRLTYGTGDQYYKLSAIKKNVTCAASDPSVLGCNHYDLYASKDNYETAAKYPSSCPKGDGKDCGKFVLGSTNQSKAFIKSSRPSSDYNAVLLAKVFEEPYQSDGKPRNCVEQTGKVCDPRYWHVGDKNPDDYQYRPYGKGPDKAENKKGKDPADTLYFMYSLPDGVTDVGFGEYTDSHFTGNPALWSYFVNFTEKNKENAFTNSYHTNSDYTHNARVVRAGPSSLDGYYRFLNHTGNEGTLRNKITGTPYCKLRDGKEWRPQCGVNSWFMSRGKVSTDMSPSNKPLCAESVRSTCHDFWNKEKGCDGAEYLVRDPLTTSKAMFEPYAGYGCAATITTYNSSLVSQLNDCYKHNKDEGLTDSLYNGYLVVKVSGGTNSTNPGGTLEGNFIIIAEDPLYTSFMDVGDNSHAFYYMEKGINTLNDATRKNTFIYSEGPIGSGNQFKLTGTIYMTAASCSGMGKLQSSSLTYDPALTQALANACIICSNDGSVCGAKCESGGGGGYSSAGGTPTTSTSTSDPLANVDPYFISNAPQLNVSIETQYQSTERTPSTYQNLGASFIVLPRIVHLPKDPVGKLSDYFSVRALNGGTLKKQDANVQCTPSLNVNTKLVSAGAELEEGLYECLASPTDYTPVPFYVWVYGSRGSEPEIRFENSHINLVANEPASVKVKVSGMKDQNIDLYMECPTLPSSNWETTPSLSGPTCHFELKKAEMAADSTFELFKVTVKEKVTESITYSLLPHGGYRLADPWTTTLGMSGIVKLCREPATAVEIESFCSENPDKCPPSDFRNFWLDCREDDPDFIWVMPNWTHGYTVGSPANNWWNILTHDATLRFKEGPAAVSGCTVIIPSDGNSIYPVEAEGKDGSGQYCLRATGKEKWHKVRLQFVGDVDDNKNPTVTYASSYSGTCTYNDDSNNHECIVPVFGNSLLSVSIDKKSSDNEGFSFWRCTGASCPTTDAVGSATFGSSGFVINDDNTVIEIHFGENDKHCFFDEFRRGVIDCDVAGVDTAQYCIDDCSDHCSAANDDAGEFTKAKWHLLSGSLQDIATSRYPTYITAASTAPDTGVKVISTVQAGIHGTLRALVQVPHLKSSMGSNSSRIRHSGFMLRSNVTGSDYLMLNVYENLSGYLEVQVCDAYNCPHKVELRDSVYNNRLSLSTSSLVMFSATLAGEDSLVVSAFLGDYYYGSSYDGPTKYSALIRLNTYNHAVGTYGYVGFKLADSDFKIHGIGWRSEDYNSECFDGPPMVSCSYAAVAVDGVIETGKLTKPWVGYSGWFDNKKCSVEYWYYNGTDVESCSANSTSIKCPTEGYKFTSDGHGQHGYMENDEDVKTAKVAMSCEHDENSVYAWTESADHAHCGPFWTGVYTECKSDIANLLGETVYVLSNEKRPYSFGSGESKNLRGESLVIEIENPAPELEVNMEIALLSKNSEWNSLEIESRSVTVTGTGATIISPSFDVVESFAANTTTGFDPEHVTGILFTNLSSISNATVKSIKALCKNAIHCGENCCSVEQKGSTWHVTVSTEGANMDKVEAIDFSAKIEGSTYLEHNNVACPGCFVDDIFDEDMFVNTDKSYQFYAKLNATGYELDLSEPYPCGSATPAGITCTAAPIGPVEEGKPWPKFVVTLDGCPDSKCVYNVTLGSNTVVSNVKQPSGTYDYQYQADTDPQGVTPTCEDAVNGCTYKYSLASTETKKAFSCEQEFKVVKKAPDPISCSITTGSNDAGTLGASEIPATNVSVTCPDGGCTYVVKRGDTQVGNGNYSAGYGFSFDEAIAGTHTYTASISRGTETANCSGSYTITYPLNLKCGSFTDPGATTPVAAGTTIDPPEAVLDETGIPSGCGSDQCSYVVTGITGVSGSDYNGTGAISTFTDASGAGKKTYTLTVSRAEESISCPFQVTYAGAKATCTLSKTGPYVPGATNIYFNVSNFKNIVNTSFTGTFACSPASTNASGTTGCDPNNGSNGQCNQLGLKAPDAAGTYTCTFKDGTTDLCGDMTMTVFDPFTCSVKQDGVEVTSIAKGSTISFSMTKSTNSLGDASFSNCGIKVNGNCWNGNNNNCNDGAANVTNQSIQINTNSSSVTIGYSCNSHSNTSFTGCSKTIEVTGGGGGGGGSGGTPVTAEIDNYISYSASTTYSVSVGSEVRNGFGCHVDTKLTSNTVIGTFNGTDITVWGNNNWSSRVAISPDDTYTFILNANAPSDLTCALGW